MLRPCLGIAAFVLLSGVLSRGEAAPSGPSKIERAKEHYATGVVHYNLQEFQPALDSFKEAYRLKPDPAFLFNIGQCYRKLGENNQALTYYKSYLRSFPNASNRPEVEKQIAELQAAGPGPDAKPPTAPPAPAPTPTPDPISAPPPVPAVALPAAPPPAATVAAEPAAPAAPAADKPPIYGRWWFWTGIGVVIAGGIAAGLAVTATDPKPYSGQLGTVTIPRK